MKSMAAIFCLFSVSSTVFALDSTSVQIKCTGLTTVGIPIDPGYSTENYGISNFKASVVISEINKCDGSSDCWFMGSSVITFRSIPGMQVIVSVGARQERASGPVKLVNIGGKLLHGNKILAVSESWGASTKLINPEPYQILYDLGKPDTSIYQGFEQGLLKGKLLSSITVSCSVGN